MYHFDVTNCIVLIDIIVKLNERVSAKDTYQIDINEKDRNTFYDDILLSMINSAERAFACLFYVSLPIPPPPLSLYFVFYFHC